MQRETHSPEVVSSVLRIMDSDVRFFERFPDRSNRIRLAGRAEIAMMKALPCELPHMRHGDELFVAVRKVGKCFLRELFTRPKGSGWDMSEDAAKAFFDNAVRRMQKNSRPVAGPAE